MKICVQDHATKPHKNFSEGILPKSAPLNFNMHVHVHVHMYIKTFPRMPLKFYACMYLYTYSVTELLLAIGQLDLIPKHLCLKIDTVNLHTKFKALCIYVNFKYVTCSWNAEN